MEWTVIRKSMGTPRRFSNAFLREERNKLEEWRQRVRTIYATTGANMLPPDIPRPLSVGQKVRKLLLLLLLLLWFFLLFYVQLACLPF